MRAIVQSDYGSPDVLRLKDVDNPVVKEDEVLVGVKAAAINVGDVFSMRGSPWAARLACGVPKPKNYIPGWDMAGRVHAVGNRVIRFQPGDEVFGSSRGSLAEYVSVAEDDLAMKPTNLAFDQAAAVPTAPLPPFMVFATRGSCGLVRRS